MSDNDVEDLLRQLTPRVLGALTRRYGVFDLCEDATQEALLAAATQWPAQGIPDNPRAWLVTAASRRLTDLIRSDAARRRREERDSAMRSAYRAGRRRDAGQLTATTACACCSSAAIRR